MKHITVDGEPLELEGDDLVEPAAILVESGINDADLYDLVFVGDPGRSHIMSELFALVDGAEFVTARKSATAA